MKIKTKRGARRIRNQRVITKRFVTTDYTGCSYITAGKRYEVIEQFSIRLVRIVNDDGDKALIATRRLCPHLHEIGTWCYVTI